MRRRAIIIGLGSVAIIVVLAIVLVPRLLKPEQVSTQTYWPTLGWRTSTPEEQGFDSGKLAEELLAMGRIHPDSILIIRNGYVVMDAYFYPYENTIPHKLASVTKSVMTTLIGIAADQGKLQLDQPMVSFFLDRTIANLDDRKEQVTVLHLVSMMNGFQSADPDWVQAALDRKMVREPGASFCYDSPGMHLLSAILQQATGMTAFEFARENLFEPLGIHEAFWQSDPQGYTHGWGDLYLKPLDAAKIGYLWLNGGAWEDRQIVSASWVADSVRAYSSAGEDGYGYGWWVSEDSYFAFGRGGQNIRMYPSFNAIVVITAGGYSYDQIESLLVAAFASPDEPLPANTANVAWLDMLLTALAQPAEPWPSTPLPDSAAAIAGLTYVFEPNPLNVASLRLACNETSEARLYMRFEGVDVVWPIGLDGKYRIAPNGQALRGYWADPQTFVFMIFEDGPSTVQFRFQDDRVGISLPETGVRFEGQIGSP
jgi:CubicO group peptidase (beta-lactamase class C family)